MNYSLKNILIRFSLLVGLSAVLKFYAETSDRVIMFLLILTLFTGLIRILVNGFINPPSWLYRIRFSVQAVFTGIFIGIMLYGVEAIEGHSFVVNDLLVYILIGAVIGGAFNNSMMPVQYQKLNRRKGLFLLERQLVKDIALLVKENGETIKGKLVLTNDHLIFLDNDEKILQKEVHEIDPGINKIKWLGIPDGIRIENDEIILRVPFPYYWIMKINKRKSVRMTA